MKQQPDTLGLKVGEMVEYENYYGRSREWATIRGVIKYIGTLHPGIVPGVGPLWGGESAYLILPTEIVLRPHGDGLHEVTYQEVANDHITFRRGPGPIKPQPGYRLPETFK